MEELGADVLVDLVQHGAVTSGRGPLEGEAVGPHCQPLSQKEAKFLAVCATCTVSKTPKVCEQVPLAWCSRNSVYSPSEGGSD